MWQYGPMASLRYPFVKQLFGINNVSLYLKHGDTNLPTLKAKKLLLELVCLRVQCLPTLKQNSDTNLISIFFPPTTET
jgi:hypothetical protein